MHKLPPRVEEYLRKSPYGFTDLEIARIARRLAESGLLLIMDEAVIDVRVVECTMLWQRAFTEQTPRSIAVYHQALHNYGPKGLVDRGPICPCGSFQMHYDLDGPDPLLAFCDDCLAPVSERHNQAMFYVGMLEMEFRGKHPTQNPPSDTRDPQGD